ncbi:unnamed protein product, partial [Symbiodinium sp. KB8]
MEWDKKFTTQPPAAASFALRRASALPTLNCYGRGRSDCTSSPVKLVEAVGVPSRFASSLNSCASEPSALLPPCALRRGRVGCAAGLASGAWLCKAHKLPRCSGRRTSLAPYLAHSTRHLRTCCMMQPRPRPALHGDIGDLDFADMEKTELVGLVWRAAPGASCQLRKCARQDVLAQTCCLFRVPPHFCKGVLRQCLRLAFDLVRRRDAVMRFACRELHTAPQPSLKTMGAEGWHECPSWEAVGAGARPPRLTDQLGDWPQGWQLAPIRSQAGAQEKLTRLAFACTRTGLIARRAKIVERTRACGSGGRGSARCCDATLVSPLSRTGLQQPCAAAHNGAALWFAERRKRAAYPELNGGPKQFVVLGSEAGGRWNADVQQLLRDLVRVRAHRAPPAVRSAASSTWAKRWWAMLAVSVQLAVTMAVGKPQGI